VQSNGDINQTTTASQTYSLLATTLGNNNKPFASFLVNTAQHTDTLELDSSFNLLGNTGQSSSQLYNYFDSTGAFYNCELAAAANVLTKVSHGCAP
jgi:hypothetical protein